MYTVVRDDIRAYTIIVCYRIRLFEFWYLNISYFSTVTVNEIWFIPYFSVYGSCVRRSFTISVKHRFAPCTPVYDRGRLTWAAESQKKTIWASPKVKRGVWVWVWVWVCVEKENTPTPKWSICWTFPEPKCSTALCIAFHIFRTNIVIYSDHIFSFYWAYTEFTNRKRASVHSWSLPLPRELEQQTRKDTNNMVLVGLLPM